MGLVAQSHIAQGDRGGGGLCVARRLLEGGLGGEGEVSGARGDRGMESRFGRGLGTDIELGCLDEC